MSNNVTLVGNLTKDVEMRFTPSGAAVANFGLAVNRRWKNKSDQWEEQVSFFNVTCWQDRAARATELGEPGRGTAFGRGGRR